MSILKLPENPRIVLLGGKNVVTSRIYFLFQFEWKACLFVFYDDAKVTEEVIRALKPDIGITCYWPWLLSKEMIAIPTCGWINFHPSLLPRHRGWYPAVWQILEGDVGGVTLHVIDEGADTGPIVAQSVFSIHNEDTGGDVYKKAQYAMIDLFIETWPKLFKGVELQKQDEDIASYRSKKDANDCDEIDIDHMYNAGYLIDLLRAKTFGEKGYAWYEKDGKKYTITVNIVEK